MRRGLDIDKIAGALGAGRQGKVSATRGYFGAIQLLADIKARFRVPLVDGRATEPTFPAPAIYGGMVSGAAQG